jgi:hypothetical protein
MRWTLTEIVREFQIGRAPLWSRLEQAGIRPGEDGRYSSVQLKQLFEGGMVQVRRAKIEADTRVSQMKAAILERAYVSRSELEGALAGVYIGIRRIVERSSLSERDKAALFSQLGANTDALLAGVESDRGDPAEKLVGRPRRQKSAAMKGNSHSTGSTATGFTAKTNV